MGAEADARKAAEEFIESFNSRDHDRHVASLHFPHVRLASGRVAVFATPGEYPRGAERVTEAEGWDRSTLDALETIHVSEDKVHLAATFSRYRQDGTRYATHNALWMVTKVDGRWGLQARSSFAP